MPTVPVDQSESGKSLSDGVTTVLTVKSDGSTVKHLLIEWSLVTDRREQRVF